MNKQELIDYCNDLKESKSRFINCIDVDRIIDTIKQLDEPEKVKVPQFVADWIKECKEKGDLSLGGAIQLPCPEMYEWLMDWKKQELFARAWLDGYEVEKEKRYLVKIRATKHYIAKDGTGKIFFSLAYKESFTKKELEEANFGWVFDCPGIEIEELE
ncbi:DUF1642 domain-containing protein [Streptococcus mitis]|jgi:hypothetical protein|uniref:DUF1642 domain-containing protein n=1 Tax=Streptococcus mitis TaxID=28037 RepID=UPI00206DE809|nr:MAG TPA: Protein of unknown function (DUF1642) [Caudoviricetes sp.]